jgi:histone H3/H4
MSKKAKPAAKPAAKAAAKAPKYTFYVKKAIQDFARDSDMMVGSDAYEAFNKSINNMLHDAAGRCKDNKRKTLKAYDF